MKMKTLAAMAALFTFGLLFNTVNCGKTDVGHGKVTSDTEVAATKDKTLDKTPDAFGLAGTFVSPLESALNVVKGVVDIGSPIKIFRTDVGHGKVTSDTEVAATKDKTLDLGGLLGGVVGTVTGLLGTVLKVVTGLVDSLLGNLLCGGSSPLSGITSAVNQLVSQAGSVIGGVLSIVTSVINKVLTTVLPILNQVLGTILSAAGGVGGRDKGTIEVSADKQLEVVTDLLSGVLCSKSPDAGGLAKTLGDALGSVLNVVNGVLDIGSLVGLVTELLDTALDTVLPTIMGVVGNVAGAAGK